MHPWTCADSKRGVTLKLFIMKWSYEFRTLVVFALWADFGLHIFILYHHVVLERESVYVNRTHCNVILASFSSLFSISKSKHRMRGFTGVVGSWLKTGKCDLARSNVLTCLTTYSESRGKTYPGILNML